MKPAEWCAAGDCAGSSRVTPATSHGANSPDSCGGQENVSVSEESKGGRMINAASESALEVRV